MVRKRKTKALAVLTSLVMAAGTILAVPSIPAEAASSVARAAMFRLYNPNSGEHFYTADQIERGNLESAGWKYEGIGWYAPKSSDTPVYRLYNPNAGEHHFTTSSSERQMCIDAGWKDENIGWYSDDEKSVPLYREYNPNATTGTHNYTSNKSEHDNLVSLGWADEGIGWYGITPSETDPEYVTGDTVILGPYEQDNDLSNGAEPIEWQVVGTRDGHTLLLSKYALDNKRYNESRGDITWENCTLRSWLNNDFYNTAFSSSDKKRIVTAHNENPDSYDLYKSENSGSYVYGTDGGNATDDKVFLLSWTEARDYLDGKVYYLDLGTGNYNQKLLCRPTAYAKAQGVWTNSNSSSYPADTVGCCYWWLQSTGSYQCYAAIVGSMGALYRDYDVSISGNGVRPALLID